MTNFRSNTVSVIATASNTVLTGPGFPIPVRGVNPSGVAVNPNGKYVYVVNDGSHTISVIATASNTVLTGPGLPIPVGKVPEQVAVSPDGTRAYVTNFLSDTVSVIDTTMNRRVAMVPVGKLPEGSPSPRTGHTSMSRILAPTTSR